MTTLLNNRYQIIQVLGSGGFGKTFLAEDTYMPSRRRCVIKQLKPVVNNPSMYQLIQQRFQREAATLEALGEGSTQIPKLYAYFSEQGQFFLVQEWIHGQTLASKVATTGVLSENAVREILVSLLQVLDYVHTQGIIYRDIKPENIILRESDNQPVLIDFGAVKQTMATVINSQGKLTQTMVMGTPGFMSPEQAAGRPVYASDIYSLGLTAIYLLTGKLPQELETSPQEEILWQRYIPHVNFKLAAVINKAIEYHPRDRYTTAAKMLEGLQQSDHSTIVQQQTTDLHKVSPALKYPYHRKNQLTLIVASLVFGGLAAIAFITIRQQQQAASDSTASPAKVVSEPLPVESSPTPESPSPPIASPVLPPVESPISPPPIFPQSQASPLAQFPQNKKPKPPTKTPSAFPVTSPQEAQVKLPEASELPSESIPTPELPSPTPHTVASPVLPVPVESPVPPQNQVSDEPSLAHESLPQNQLEILQKETPPPPASLLASPHDSTPPPAAENVPTFPTGTSESKVRATLGQPTKTSKGLWGNTYATIYDIKPDQVTLGYLFDRNSGHLRQTEVSFAQSVDTQVMQKTLEQMLNRNASAEINEGLQQVYQRRTNRYPFTIGELKGVIERNDRDRIYIGVWEADLH
jgi:serine/threonine-protein kinase